jgi:hypothetical protein
MLDTERWKLPTGIPFNCRTGMSCEDSSERTIIDMSEKNSGLQICH